MISSSWQRLQPRACRRQRLDRLRRSARPRPARAGSDHRRAPERSRRAHRPEPWPAPLGGRYASRTPSRRAVHRRARTSCAHRARGSRAERRPLVALTRRTWPTRGPVSSRPALVRRSRRAVVGGEALRLEPRYSYRACWPRSRSPTACSTRPPCASRSWRRPRGNGAVVQPFTEVEELIVRRGSTVEELSRPRSPNRGRRRRVEADMVVNATGPWADRVAGDGRARSAGRANSRESWSPWQGGSWTA